MSLDDKWIEERLASHDRLTAAVVPLISGILKAEGVGTLSVTGRTKSRESITQKIKDKKYAHPERELMDLTGCRVIVFLESDVQRASDALIKSLNIDHENSLDKDRLLSVNKIGYRSVHLICDIGKARQDLHEYAGLAGLKFEVQIRTVLQHAWAELEHDKNYKFSPGLPPPMVRQLNLHAGLLELADKGLDKLSKEIDAYAINVREKTLKGDLDTPIDSLSLDQFVDQWAEGNAVRIDKEGVYEDSASLIRELKEYGIKNLAELQSIIPEKYAEKLHECRDSEGTLYGMVRDWMLIHDWRRLVNNVKISWHLAEDDKEIFEGLMQQSEIEDMAETIGVEAWSRDARDDDD